MGPMIISAAASSSLERWPCVTITPATFFVSSATSAGSGLLDIRFSSFRILAVRIRLLGGDLPDARRDELRGHRTRRGAAGAQEHWRSLPNDAGRRCSRFPLSHKTFPPAYKAAAGNPADRRSGLTFLPPPVELGDI